MPVSLESKVTTVIISTAKTSSWLLAVLCLFVFSRGIFEIFTSKIVGYAFGIIGLAGIVSIAVFTTINRKGGLYPVRGVILLWFLVYASAAVVSLYATVLTSGPIGIGILYTAVHLFLLFSLLILRHNSSVPESSLWWSLHLSGILIASTGALEFLGLLEFPGDAEFDGFTRLAGSLGSKQHFSFASASLGMLLLWVYFRQKDLLSFALGLLLVLLSFASLSRNGFPVILGTLAIYFFSDLSRFIRNHLLAVVISLGLVVVLFQYQPDSFRLALQDRIQNLAAPEEQANERRIDAWRNGLDVFFAGPIFFGTKAGGYSQSGTQMGLSYAKHFESALVQQFVNFGIFAGVAFILFFMSYVLSIRDHFLRALAAMVAATYIYYPGSETVPIIGVWLLIGLSDAVTRPISDTTPRGQGTSTNLLWRSSGNGTSITG
jgi:hypothetical protein